MSLKFTILGCGSSLGIPRIDGYYGNCDPKNKKNIRSRCSALIRSKNLNILIDTSPDLKNQLLQNKVKNIDKVFYTHAHADQTHGINELRVFTLKNRKKIPIYADLITKRNLINTFGYCLDTAEPIGLKRLMARPVAKYTIAAQEKHEKDEKVHADD